MPITRNTNIKNAVLNPLSRYTQGGATDRFNNRLGFWDRYAIPYSSSDFAYVVDARTKARPDLIAYDVYEKANLQWLVLQYNNIVDINEEIVVGARLILPTPARLSSSILTRSTGGELI